MANSTCSVRECARPHKARGYCVAHYARWRKTGSPIRTCESCGNALETSNRGKYCDSGCKPRCKADGCELPRWYSDGYCSNHHQIFERHGVPVGVRKWAEESDNYVCIVCGTEFEPNSRSRQFCHVNCQGLYSRWGGNVPDLSFECAICKVHIEWAPGAWTRRDRKICSRCRNAGQTRHGVRPSVLVERDGVDCKLCGAPVDMAARYPDPKSASVDHIIPVSRGGTHDLENLQLTHWKCNHTKRDRIDFVLA